MVARCDGKTLDRIIWVKDFSVRDWKKVMGESLIKVKKALQALEENVKKNVISCSNIGREKREMTLGRKVNFALLQH